MYIGSNGISTIGDRIILKQMELNPSLYIKYYK